MKACRLFIITLLFQGFLHASDLGIDPQREDTDLQREQTRDAQFEEDQNLQQEQTGDIQFNEDQNFQQEKSHSFQINPQ